MTPTCCTLLAMCGLLSLSVGNVLAAEPPEGASRVACHGYTGCVQLDNGAVRVVLDPNCGGRVLEYSLRGENAIYVDPAQDGWTWSPGGPSIDPSGGRCDIGPEDTIPAHPKLWLGKWKAEITGPRSARLTSVEDDATGVQLIRDFRLDRVSSHLVFTQTIRNVSAEPQRWFHWGRTFAQGNGIALIPLTPHSRYPLGYILYGPGPVINYRPEPHPNVAVRDGFFLCTGEPAQPQYGFDTFADWFAYLTRSNLLFVKRFPTYPDRPYGEIPAPTVVIWYNRDRMCELEPIAPREIILPGKRLSYTEDWWLFPYQYPADKQVDLKAVTALVEEKAKR